MATKPTDAPAWATSDIVDGTSGQNNKVKPPGAYETGGWSYQEKPARNYDNWVKWNLSEWVNYLDTATVRGPTYKIAASDSATDSKNQADAVCDGTDDDVEINDAITAVSATGGVVLLSEGTYSIRGQVQLDDNVHLVGMGIGATTLSLAATAVDPLIVSATSKSDASISRMSLDGNRSLRAIDDTGIELSGCSRVVITDVDVSQVGEDSSGGDGVLISNSSDCKLTRVLVSGCDGSGFEISSTGTSSRNVFENCSASSCNDHGFLNNGSGTKLSSCDATACGLGGFVDAGTASDTLVTGCSVDGCGTTLVAAGVSLLDGGRADGCRVTGHLGLNGFQLSGDDASISGCLADTCSGNGIQVDGENCAVSGCLSKASGADGLELTATADGCSVAGCTLSGNAGNGVTIRSDYYSVTGCTSRANSEIGFLVRGSNGIVSGCLSVLNQHQGFLVSLGNAMISSCRVYNNGQQAATGFDGIALTGSVGATVTGCAVKCDTSPNGHEFGVRTGTSSVIHSNDLHLSTTSGLAADAINGTGVTIPRYPWDGAANTENAVDYANRVDTQ
jgi:hypothetical protein